MRVLITGAAGQVGRALMTHSAAASLDVTGCGHGELDLLDADGVERYLADARPDVVINSAAYTAVDAAEEDDAAAFAVNRDGADNLARGCDRSGAALIHLSTDYVFDGSRPGERREDEETAPLGVYGASKLAGEEAVRGRLERHVIVRLSWVFGEHGKNFAKTMLRLAGSHEELRVVADQHGCPTYTGHIADALYRIVGQLPDAPAWGTFHYRDAPPTTWHGFAEAIVAALRGRDGVKARRVIPVATEAFPTPAQRPANSVLNCAKIAAAYGIAPGDWARGVDRVIAAANAAA